MKPLGPSVQKSAKTAIWIYSVQDEKMTQKIINAAFQAGAGEYQEYVKVAFVDDLQGNWFSKPTARPHQGQPGAETRENCTLIAMTCPQDQTIIERVIEAILAIHPWEEPVIQVFAVEEYTKLNVANNH